MFIYIEIVKPEYYQREKNERKKQKTKQLDNNDNNIDHEKKRQKSTAPGIPRRSPIQVLTGINVA